MTTAAQLAAARDLIAPARREVLADVQRALASADPDAALGALADELLEGAAAAFGADHGHDRDAVLQVLRSL
jgi:hypothetical protein